MAFALVTGIPDLLPLLVEHRVQIVFGLALLCDADEVLHKGGGVLERRNGMKASEGIVATATAAGLAERWPACLAKNDLFAKVTLKTLRLQVDVLA